MAVPSKVAARISAGIKRFQPILAAAKSRDVNESDTVVMVADMLQEVFGYDKYAEITSEHSIRGTFCDLAIKLEGTLIFLVETKAIGLELKDNYVKQAVDYAANQGVDWVVLTSGAVWRVYKVAFTKPIEHELVVEINFLELNPKSDEDVELLWMLSKESWPKECLRDYLAQRQALNRFTLAAIILTDTVVATLRKELKRVSPGVRIEPAEIENVLRLEVLKREILEGDKADDARKLVAKAAGRALRASKSENGGDSSSNDDNGHQASESRPAAPQ